MSMWRVITEFSGLPGTPYVNALFFDLAAGTSVAAATAVDTFWGAVDAQLDDNLDWTRQSDVAQIDEVTGDLEGLEGVAAGSGSGAAAGEMAPTVLQALIRWRTEVPFDGRLLQGRTFIPGLPEVQLSDGVLPTSTAGIFNTAGNNLIATANAALVVWRRPVYTQNPDGTRTLTRNGAFAHVVTSSVPTKFAVLRSRRD